jgi:hypothetical protein
LPEPGLAKQKGFTMKTVTLAALTAAAIAASAIVPSVAYAAPAPHYKPLICMLLPTIDVCTPPKPVMHHHHMMMKKKP